VSAAQRLTGVAKPKEKSDSVASTVTHIDINLQNWEKRAAIHARDVTGGYMLDRFRAGEDCLHAIESAELGDICGKRACCICSTGTRSVWRSAAVTGIALNNVRT
jgi:hypothetical protein